jgi:hypothetical protein
VWEARNDTVARLLGDPALRERPRWVRRMRAAGAPADMRIDREELTTPSWVVMGDTGEGDASQYAVVPPLLAAGGDTDFMVLASDVVYPAGAAVDYPERFYRPYRDYPAPILAVPGNHDWYDGLVGFMLAFCEADPPVGRRRGLRELAWRRTPLPEAGRLEAARALRGAPGQQSRQPGPYWMLDTGPVRVVAVDTGIAGELDAAQGTWLREAARSSSKPKVLLTGTPIFTKGEHRPVRIKGGGTVDEIVRDPAHRFVAVAGGDTHNYQRYPVRVEDGRIIHHVVCGGGGAYLDHTHGIPRIDLPGVDEQDFRCYPLRGDSLAIYSRLYERWARRSRGGSRQRQAGSLELSPDAAAALMAERLGVPPVRPGAREHRITASERRAADVVFPPGGYRGWNRFFSQYFDWNEPPLFRSFVRFDASADELRLRCYAATGCGEHEAAPPVEDEVVIPLR